MTSGGMETWESPTGRVLSGARSTLEPVLTVLWHPDASRIGDRAVLLLEEGEGAELSRTRPELFSPDGERVGALADPRLSRRPVVLRRRGRCLELEASRWRTRLEVDGVEVRGRLPLDFERIGDGVVLVLARTVTLLLHLAPAILRSDAPRCGLVGESPLIHTLRAEIPAVAASDVSVLVRGASGTGKELVARALHEHGPRARKAFVAVDLGALTPSLASAELFGVVRGAFTGADATRAGHFVEADGGTLFLDEIGEAPPEVQTTLLRVLETRRVRPVGGSAEREVDVRVVAATDADLDAAARDGGFRAALLHRLAGYVLETPRLAARREDVGRLLLHLLEREGWSPGPGDDATRFVPARLVASLARHPWPGNVRQLANVARQLAIAGRAGGAPRLPLGVRRLVEEVELGGGDSTEPASRVEVEAESAPTRRGSSYRPISEIEDAVIVATLERHRWRAKPAAEELGVSRSSLYRRLETLPGVVRAGDLDRVTIDAALVAHAGALDAAAQALRVSREALQLRLRELDLS
ncbi:MAG: sigma 54-interacting transcriptional regulator [Acidobacteriota bacterium]